VEVEPHSSKRQKDTGSDAVCGEVRGHEEHHSNFEGGPFQRGKPIGKWHKYVRVGM
jgi:hypothetical protein